MSNGAVEEDPPATRVFFAYPFEPEVLRETVTVGAELIRATKVADTIVWQDLVVAGRRIIRSITDQIDASQVIAAEVTDLNRNVLFELGYAIGKGLKVWPLRDRTRNSGHLWDDFGLLRAIGVVQYSNAEDIRIAFLRRVPTLPFRPSTVDTWGAAQRAGRLGYDQVWTWV